MEEAMQSLLKMFYSDEVPSLDKVQVLSWSPETGFICLRWREGDSTIAVKSFNYGAQKVITQIT